MSAADEVSPGAPGKLEGIGGWLILAVLQLTIPILILPGASIWGLFVTHLPPFDYVRRLFTFSMLPLWVFVGFGAYCLTLLLQRRRTLPKLMVAYFGICLLDLLVYWVRIAGNYPSPQRYTVEIHLNLPYPFDEILQLILLLAWIGYFLTSARVKNTFTR